MGDDNNKQAPDRQEAIDAAKKSVELSDVGHDLAKDQLDQRKKMLETKQKIESKQLETKTKQAKADIEKQTDAAKSELMVSGMSAEKKEQAAAAIDQAKAEIPNGFEAPKPAPTVDGTVPVPDQPAQAETTDSSDATKGIWDKIKDFFGKMFEGTWLAKLFGTDKPGDVAVDANPIAQVAVSPTSSPTADSSAPTAAPQASTETGKSNESWRSVVADESARLQIDPAFAEAIVNVEAGKHGINPDGSLVIRFEPHILNAELKKKGISKAPGSWDKDDKVKGRNVDGVSCEGGQANEHACLKKAMEINPDAALNSISMGMGQIMGFNAKLAGYSNSQEMFNRFSGSSGGEPEQVRAMFKVIESTPILLRSARAKDFSVFSSAYNGAKAGSSKHAQYVSALEGSYNKSKKSGNPPSAVA